MKFLLVLALALVAVSAEEEKKELKFLPYGFHQPLVYNNHYAVPSVYNNFPYNYYPYNAYYNPVQIKPVAKEVEVEVKKIEFVEPEGACKNHMGALVPCRKGRSADEEEMKPEEEKKIIPLNYGYPLAYNYPTFYNQYYNQYPLAYNYAHFAHPVVYNAAGCTNNQGKLVPCRVARSADEEMPEMKEAEMEEEKKIIPLNYGYPLAYNYPTFYNQYYNQYPLAYNYHHVAPVTYTAPKPVVQEVEYLKPVLKEVVQKVPLVAACRNSFGYPVPCANTE